MPNACMNQYSWPRSFYVIIEVFPANLVEMAGQADLVNGDSQASGVSEEKGRHRRKTKTDICLDALSAEAGHPPQRTLPNTQPCPNTSLHSP